MKWNIDGSVYGNQESIQEFNNLKLKLNVPISIRGNEHRAFVADYSSVFRFDAKFAD